MAHRGIQLLLNDEICDAVMIDAYNHFITRVLHMF